MLRLVGEMKGGDGFDVDAGSTDVRLWLAHSVEVGNARRDKGFSVGAAAQCRVLLWADAVPLRFPQAQAVLYCVPLSGFDSDRSWGTYGWIENHLMGFKR